jgi:hypothetical protein
MTKCCDTHTSECDCTPPGDNACCADSQCPSQADSPVDHVAGLWKDSFFHAMKEVQVETLKAKILKAWGPMIDKEADALVKAMESKWEAMTAEVKAQEACDGFKHTLRDLWLNKKQ